MTRMASSGIGKLFGLVKNKPPKPPRKDYDDNSDEGDPYEYQDPSKIHSTLPPPNPGSQAIPNYPPPRPHHSPQFPTRSDQDKRASAPVLSPPELPAFPQGRTRPQRPQSSEHSKYFQEYSSKTSGSGDDYQDPWDSKAQSGPVSDYCDPWDSTRQSHRLSKGKEDYSDPWDTKRLTPALRPRSGESRERDASAISREKSSGSVDDYCDPWDSKKQDLKLKEKDDYTDPWDAKKPAPKSSSSTSESHERDSDEDSYSEPYDAGKITVLDEQARRMSLKGMRQSSSGGKDNIYDDVYDLEVKKPKTKASKKLSGGNDEVFHEEVTKKKAQSPTLDDRPLDDYDTPWETKKSISAFRGNKKAPEKRTPAQQPTFDSRQADDYDRPWEWTKKSGGGNAPTSPAHSKSTDPSQTPKIDTRPADDYDAPWEFISRRSAQFASKMQEHATAGQPSGPPKPPRTFIGDEDKHRDEVEEFFDPNLPLDQQGWYHGPISRMEAENLLRESEDCSYLVRNSESSKKDYSLSVRNNETFMHLKIQCNWEGKYILGQFSKPFDTLPEMIYFYTVNKLNIRGAEHKKLRSPVVPSNFYHVLEKTHL